MAQVVDINQARARRAARGVKVLRGQGRRVNPAERPPVLEQAPGFMIPAGTAVRLKELPDGDVVALDVHDRRTWHARIGFVSARWKIRRRPRGGAQGGVDRLDDAA